MNCRMCLLPEAHVHEDVGDTVHLAHIPPKGFEFEPSKFTNIDFALPAVKQNGTWWICTAQFLEMVWPLWKASLAERGRQLAKKIELEFESPIEPDYEESDQHQDYT